MSQITTIINELNKVPSGAWATLLASPVLSSGLQALKHWLSIQSEKTMVALMVLGSAIGAGAYYLLHTPSQNPDIIVMQTAILGFATTPFYYFAIKPLYQKFIVAVEAEETANEQQLKSAIIPPQGIPLHGTTISTLANDSKTPQQVFEESVDTSTDFSH